MSYTPNPYDAAQPTEDKFVVTAAAEFRALKALVASLLPGASYAGAWSALTGPMAAGKLVAHASSVWLAITSLADVTASEPGVTADWVNISGVKRSGDTMTGPLSVPAGASGAQVPQAQEIGTLANTQLTTHYKQSNILGTVSQSGGVPTGAIIEQGANANGRYVRFADGTQICYHYVPPTSKASSTRVTAGWTFPATFVGGAVHLVGNVAINTIFAAGWNLDLIYSVSAETASDSSGTLYLHSDQNMNTNWTTVRIFAIAIGRWF